MVLEMLVNGTPKSEREATGMGDQYSEQQPTSMPNIDMHLFGQRLDICELYELEEGGTELRWSQGKVVTVSDGSNIIRPGSRTACFKKGEGILVCWDANEERNEVETVSAQKLLKTKWNPKIHCEGAWRLDILVK